MPRVEEDWGPLVSTLGFRSEEDMLRQFYLLQGFSIKELAKILGYTTWTVRRRLILWGIPLRQRGGPNNAGRRLLADTSDEEIFNTPLKEVCAKYNVHESTIFAERRLRKWSSALSVQPVTSTDGGEKAPTT